MMDGSGFDALIQSVVGPRRALLGGAVALAAGWLGIGDAAAKRKGKKKKKKKAKPNAYGCLDVGDPCKSAEGCCSGICTGKKGKRTCRAHGGGTCRQELTGLCSDPPTLATCNDSETCYCLRTTANSNFCAQLGQALCTDCQKDADCEALGLPPGSACLPTEGALCADQCPETGMVCLAPCGQKIEN
jgi:hypothetical protein